MDRVVIGAVPHKLSVTIEARDNREILRATGRFATDAQLPPAAAARAAVAGADLGGGRRQRDQPPAGAAAAGQRGTGAGRAGQAGRPGPGLRHRAGPQDRRLPTRTPL